MAMISGPFTDEVVKMLMKGERRLFDGELLKNPKGQWGVLFQQEVWIADPLLRTVSEQVFDVKNSSSVDLPEPYGDTFRFTEGDGNIYLPEYKEEDKAFLRRCGYCPASPAETLTRLKKEEGTEQHKLYPVSCRVGVWAEDDVAEVLRILTHLYD
ncbi:MAG: hypothetical protein IIY02_07320 [Firmicutes bacterium]|nr:hypothetical protein [Bacillota bacterium]